MFYTPLLFSQQQLGELATTAHDHCPSTELLETEFPINPRVKNTKVKNGEPTKDAPSLNGFNLTAYKELASKTTPILMEQSSHGIWFCKEGSPEFPGAFMTLESTSWPKDTGKSSATKTDSKIPMSQEKPVGTGAFANPVQICLFSAQAFYLQTLALELALMGYTVQSLESTMALKMNKRKVMCVDKDTSIFDASNCTFDIALECAASDEEVSQAVDATNQKCPSVSTMGSSIKLNYSIRKKGAPTSADEAECCNLL